MAQCVIKTKTPATRSPALQWLEDFGQFAGEGASRFLIPLFSSAAAIGSVWTLFRPRAVRGRSRRSLHSSSLGGLGRVSAKNLVFERGSVETANDGLHFV